MTRRNWMWSLSVAFVCAACSSDNGGEGDSDIGDVGVTDMAGTGNATTVTGGAAGASGNTAGAPATNEVPVLGTMTPARENGQVVAPWDALCVATFERDYDIADYWGDVDLSVHAGDRYLHGEGGLFTDATIVFVGADGPVEFDIELEPGETLPFASSCDGIATTGYVGVFVDAVVYQDADLTIEACTLPAGAYTRGSSVNYYAAQSSAAGFVYHVEFSGFDDLCDGHRGGYVAASRVAAGDTSYTTVPFARVSGPIEL